MSEIWWHGLEDTLLWLQGHHVCPHKTFEVHPFTTDALRRTSTPINRDSPFLPLAPSAFEFLSSESFFPVVHTRTFMVIRKRPLAHPVTTSIDPFCDHSECHWHHRIFVVFLYVRLLHRAIDVSPVIRCRLLHAESQLLVVPPGRKHISFFGLLQKV